MPHRNSITFRPNLSPYITIQLPSPVPRWGEVGWAFGVGIGMGVLMSSMVRSDPSHHSATAVRHMKQKTQTFGASKHAGQFSAITGSFF